MIDFNGGNKPEIITDTLVRVCLCAVYGNKPRKLPRELLILTWCLIFFLSDYGGRGEFLTILVLLGYLWFTMAH